MLCRRCEVLVSQLRGCTATPARPTTLRWERFHTLLCARCGAVLPAVDPTDAMLQKLSQLARFGLTAGGKPILQPSRPNGPGPSLRNRCVES